MDDRYSETSDDFEFEAGDTVLVRIGEHGQSGNLRAKFVAEVSGFTAGVIGTTDTVNLDPPWDNMGTVTLNYYDAEFEVIDGPDEVNF